MTPYLLVHRQFAHLPGEICAPWRCGADGRDGWVVPYLRRPGARSRSPISSERCWPISCWTKRPRLQRRGHRFMRYADNMIILVKSERAAQRVMQSITRYLEHTVKLKVNPAKSKVAPMSECSFLSFTIKGKKIRWTDKALAQFKHRVKALTGRSWGVSMDYRLHKLGQYIRGWTGYFGISQYYQPVPELDEWIRRRIRMCYWKTQFQWRLTCTQVMS